MFQANHEDAYDSDVDEGPNAAVAFMANLSSTSATNSQVNEVHSNDNPIFDNVDYQLNQEMHQEEHLDSDAETEIDDNTIPYHQYLLDTEAQNVPTEVSADTSDKVSMIAILTDLQTQLDGHAKICLHREHTKVLELEAEVFKQQKMVIESEKRNSHLQKNHIDLQLKFQNYKQCIDTSSASNAIFEINKLRNQLQGKDDTIRNLETQINITRMLNVGSTEGSCDQQALETDRIQLQDMITSLRIQLDGLKVENVSLKRRYDELSQANTHSRTANTEKLSALTAENTKLKAQVTGKTSSGPSTSEKPKVLASGIYNVGSKYIPPPKRANWVKPSPLPKKKQVTFQEPHRTSTRPTQKPPVQQNKKPNVSVNLPTRTKPATEPRKPMPKSDTRNHRIWPSKSENARRAAIHNRNLNFDHNQFVIRSLKSVNTKTPQAKHNGNHTKKVWKATRKHNVNTTKTAWRPKKVVGSVKPQWFGFWGRASRGTLAFVEMSKGRTVADSIAARLTRPTAYNFKTDCMILWNAEERDVVPPGPDIYYILSECAIMNFNHGSTFCKTESDDDGDDFVHPKLTTHDDDIIHKENTDEDDSSISSSDEENSDNDGEGTNSSSVSSGFVSNMLNPNQDTGIDDIFGQYTEATSLIDTHISILNLPNFASLFGFDHRLKALEDNFSELRQTNQYAEALSSIPSTVEQYLANKMQEAVDVAVQLKYERIREESTTANQQFLDSIDDGMKKIIKEQVKKEVSKIIPKVEKFVTDQLESEVLVRSSKEANTSHAVAANLSELELKKILIDKMEANNSINRSDIQKQLHKALVEAYEADKILLDTYGDTVTIKRPRDGADDDQEPSAGTDRGSKRRRGKLTLLQMSLRFFSRDRGVRTGVQDEQAEEEVQHLPDWFQKPTRLPSPDHAWNTSVPAVHESVQPWLSNLAQQDPRESFDELTDSSSDATIVSSKFSRSSCYTISSLHQQRPEYLRGSNDHQIRQIRPLGNLALGQKAKTVLCICNLKDQLERLFKRGSLLLLRLQLVDWQDFKLLTGLQYEGTDDVLYQFKEGDVHD
ncbi:hypothetical protein Tco_0053828 [Tanacetum coccineum]